MNSASNPAENNILLTNDKKIRGYRTKRRAYTGIEPVTSRTLSENHTTRPAGLNLKSQTFPTHALHSHSSIHLETIQMNADLVGMVAIIVRVGFTYEGTGNGSEL